HPEAHAFPTRRSSDLNQGLALRRRQILKRASRRFLKDARLNVGNGKFRCAERGFSPSIALSMRVGNLLPRHREKPQPVIVHPAQDRKSTRLNSSHLGI